MYFEKENKDYLFVSCNCEGGDGITEGGPSDEEPDDGTGN